MHFKWFGKFLQILEKNSTHFKNQKKTHSGRRAMDDRVQFCRLSGVIFEPYSPVHVYVDFI